MACEPGLFVDCEVVPEASVDAADCEVAPGVSVDAADCEAVTVAVVLVSGANIFTSFSTIKH